MKKLLTIFILIISFTCAKAQFQGSFGPTIGGNLGFQYVKEPNIEAYNLFSIRGLNYGVMAFLTWHPKAGYRKDGMGYGFRPTLSINQKGSIQKEDFKVGGIKSRRCRLTYIELAVPIIMKEKELEIFPNAASIFLGIGPTIGKLLSNTITTTSTSSSIPVNNSKLAVGSKATDDIKPYNYGIKAVVGSKFGHFSASLELDIGLNHSPQPDTYISNRQLAINLAWMLNSPI
ncbi:MAG TPA: outer membrane beta-barrel protein [Edaphocola sp.]|nr:outer membrane beta-barrel protein [Edaphocola sp.]